MIRIKYIISVIAVALFLCGCTVGENAEPGTAGAKKVSMQIGLYTRALNGGEGTAEQESMVRSAYVFIFNNAGVLENRGDIAITTGEVIDADQKLNKIWTVHEGDKEIYIVANPDTELALRLTSSLTKTQLLKLFTNQSGFDPAGFAARGMLMTGRASAAVSELNKQIDIPVYRRHARIDLLLKKEDGLTANVVLKSVKLADQEQAGIVFAAGTTAYSGYSGKADQTNTMSLAIVDDFSAEVPTSFYTYPRPAAPENMRAMRLEMVVEIDGEGKMLPVYINSGALDGRAANDPDLPLAIFGNTVYQVKATLTRQSVDVALTIFDWENAHVTTPIHGTTLWVERSKITMDSSGTASVGYRADAAVSIDVTTTQPWLNVSYTSGLSEGTITLTHVGTSQTAQPDAVITLRAGNITRTITVAWSAVSVV